jgi:hypothetical protein
MKGTPMGKVFLGILLILIGVRLLLTVLAVDSIPVVGDLLVAAYCKAPETNITTSQQYNSQNLRNSTLWHCEDTEGNRREVTNQIGFTAVGLFLVPFFAGLGLILSTVDAFVRRIREQTSAAR